ncbi:MAG: hypothetical protein ACP5VE_15270 [Chthonomonadales bacterium]
MIAIRGEITEGQIADAAPAGGADLLSAAGIILSRFGARAVTLVSAPRQAEDGRRITPRISANDAYAALEEACWKMARVALRRYRRAPRPQVPFDAALDTLFPDPAAYLARAIKSVVSDAARLARREIPTLSLEQPLGAADGDHEFSLADLVAEERTPRLPEPALIEQSDRTEFRSALKQALRQMPANYLRALGEDLKRGRQRQHGRPVQPETDRQRQTVCRARAALATLIRRNCSPDNPYIHLLNRQRNSRVARKIQPSANWSGERREALFRRLMETSWVQRAAAHPDGSVEEAVVNEVSGTSAVAPPSPEMRQAMRVLDLYTVDHPLPKTPEARTLWEQAKAQRAAGRLEEALRLYRACYEAEPSFLEALNEVGVVLSQMGNLRDALKVYLTIIRKDASGDHAYIAATNAADIYLTWFDAGRNKEHNIEQAIAYAKLAMQHPTPMRACNLILAYAKDRYFDAARQVMERILSGNMPSCPADKFLQTLFQIRDPDLVAWWSWLESELDREQLQP